MVFIKPSAITAEILCNGSNGIPLIMCTDIPRVKKKLKDAGYIKVSVNAELAKALLEYPIDERQKHVEKEFNRLYDDCEPIWFDDFEMLFDPRYEIDVIKLFCEKARKTNVAVNWPGKLVNEKLIYGEPECEDYHEYHCNLYQIRIVP